MDVQHFAQQNGFITRMRWHYSSKFSALFKVLESTFFGAGTVPDRSQVRQKDYDKQEVANSAI